MAQCIMVQGTMSGAGKSLLVTALCRIFARRGFRVAPFKSQNMALNSFVTPDGLEIGRAQAAQAEAAGIPCDVRMNPILLKPSSDTGSQLIVLGEVRGQYDAQEYFRMKRGLIPTILSAYNSLAAENDIIVIEGAGSPAEINLREDDIVNMGLAELVNAPVLLAGDIDRGGVFAQLYGTVELLRPEERKRVAGMVINKFRGDVELLKPGLRQIEALTGIPVLGVVPWLQVDIDDEDSLAPRLTRKAQGGKALDIAVIQLPHISNFTDFAPLEEHPDINLYYVNKPEQLGNPDLLILPGTKNTMGDLCWLKESGFAERIVQQNAEGVPVLGICGGFQMLGRQLLDPDGVETGGTEDGLGLLPCETVFTGDKTRTRKTAVCTAQPFRGAKLEGYEIHMGRTQSEGEPFCRFTDGTEDGAVRGNVFGTYLHGLFDTGELTEVLVRRLAQKKGIAVPERAIENRARFRDRQYEKLADAVEASLDMDAIRRVMEAYAHENTTGRD
ncbi:MAG: cobyric acid synthase [Oscillospiraceae bacterium]|nr:cobyric acid synthase [Oscillospiraceae bacterium]